MFNESKLTKEELIKINKSSTDKDIIEGLFSLALIKCNDIDIISEITTRYCKYRDSFYKEKNDLSISDIDKDKIEQLIIRSISETNKPEIIKEIIERFHEYEYIFYNSWFDIN